LSGAHLEILPEIMSLLHDEGMDDVIVVVGGIIPVVDRQPLKDIGISEVFGPGTTTTSIVEYIEQSVKDRAKA
jgi:methylmalonyl-CoA mutase C-terminal domain/subunit